MEQERKASDVTSVVENPYTGRWVALVAGQISGVGYTGPEAYRMARLRRPREKITLQWVEAAGGQPLNLPELYHQLQPILEQQDLPIYLVGGAVRDALLGRPIHDLDFVVPNKAIALAFRIGDELKVAAYPLDKERDTGRVVLAIQQTVIDVARFRGANLQADLQDRDFTINAMALPAGAFSTASLIDPCQGQADLAAGLIRQTHPQAIANDPVRALRAIRLAVSLGFQLSEETGQAVRAAAPLLAQVSPERIRDEFLKLLAASRPDRALKLVAEMGLLSTILPEIAALENVAQSPPHHEAVWPHTLSVLNWLAQLERVILDGEPAENEALVAVQTALAKYRPGLQAHFERPVDGDLSGRIVLRLGALFHDVGKAKTQTVEPLTGRIRFLGHDQAGAEMVLGRLAALRLSNEAIYHIEHIVAGHMRPLLLLEGGQPSRRAVYRYFRAIQSAGLDIGLLSLADHLATYDGPAGKWPQLVSLVAYLFQHYFEAHQETVAPLLLLNGHDLINLFQLRPGPQIGRLLRALEELQAAGEVNNREEAHQFIAAQLAQT